MTIMTSNALLIEPQRVGGPSREDHLGNRGEYMTPPCEPLESVSPKGGPWALGQPPKGWFLFGSTAVGLWSMAPWPIGSHGTQRPWSQGPHGTPPALGGGEIQPRE